MTADEIFQALKDAKPTNAGLGNDWSVDKSHAVQINRGRSTRERPAPFNADAKSTAGIVGQLDSLQSQLSDTVAAIPVVDTLSLSTSFNPGLLAPGAGASTTKTVTGAAVTDWVTLNFGAALGTDYSATGYVSAANTVRVTITNMNASVSQGPGTVSFTIYVRRLT